MLCLAATSPAVEGTAVAETVEYRTAAPKQENTLLCVAVTASSTAEALWQIRQATEAGADSVELRIDFLEDFNHQSTLESLLGSCTIPAIVTQRASWEG